MYIFTKRLFISMTFIFSSFAAAESDNQTEELTPVLQNQPLPFDFLIQQAEFALPSGLQSFAFGVHDGCWVLIAGRTNGLHGFNDDPNNFPPQTQNKIVYVVDLKDKQKVFSRELGDESGLTQAMIDSLSVTASQFYQEGETLYISGGYGIDSATGLFTTKPLLTAIDLPGVIQWVQHPNPANLLVYHIRQTRNPAFTVTGGFMGKLKKHGPWLLVFGHDFEGLYMVSGQHTQVYTEQVRPFDVKDNGFTLSAKALPPKPFVPNPNFRRRDLNVVPVILYQNGEYKRKLIAFAGVFTPDVGVWTVPVEINKHGKPTMANPADPRTFKQAMNQYACATLPLFSKKNKDMYTTFFGGISFGFFQNGVFMTDPEIPFINQVTSVKIDQNGVYSQYLMNAVYPVIESTQSNPGNTLLFGASAEFILADDVPVYSNGVVNLDAALKRKDLVLGYIVGGIQSTLPNTNTTSDSAASPYVFKVTLVPKI